MKARVPISLKKIFYYGFFSIAILLILIATFLFLKIDRENIIEKNSQELRNITLLKSQQVNDWFTDELKDAGDIGVSTSFVFNQITLSGQPESAFRTVISDYLKGVATEHDYNLIFLTDSNGAILYSSSKMAVVLDPLTNKVLYQTLPGKASNTDVVIAEDGGTYIDFVVTLHVETKRYPVPAFMVMRIDPGQVLYSWLEKTYLNIPVQMLLLRKDNNNVELLNDLKYSGRPDTYGEKIDSQFFETLLSNINNEGRYAGIDSRGVEVLGYVNRVENTSWYLVALVDKSEVLQWFYRRMYFVLAIFLLVAIITALLFSQYSIHKNSKFYKKYGREQAKFKATIYSIGDAVIITDNSGRIQNLNPAAEKITGWREADATANPVMDVFHLIREESRGRIENPLEDVLKKGKVITLENHTLLVRRDGTEVPILDSMAPIMDINNKISGAVIVFRDQSEERKRQHLVEQSELNYRRIFITNPQPMLIYNVDTYQILEVNDAMIQLYGYSHEEFLNMDVKALRPTSELPVFLQKMNEGADKVMHMGEIWKHKLKNGETILVEITSHQIIYNKQKARHVLITNVTQRLEVEKALMESEQKFRLLFENHAAKKFIVNPATAKIEEANLAACKFYGWSKDEFRGMDLSVINMLSKEEIRKQIKQTEAAPEATFEFKHRKKDGTVFDAEVFSSKIVADDKVLLHSIVQDITERKQAEKKVDLLIRSIDQSPVGIFIADESAIITYVNPYLCEMTGYDAEEIYGRTPFLLSPASEPLSSEIKATLHRGEEWKGELEDRKKNGEPYWKNVAISALRNSQGEIINYVIIQEDITLRRKIMADLIESQQRAQESDRLKSSFLANMSHEIRTPMNGILGFMDLLQDENLTSDEREEYMALVKTSGNRLLSTINDIIDISKIESGQMVLNISQFNINNLLNRLLLLFNAEMYNKDVKLIFSDKCDETGATIRSDMAKLESIYSNLIKNAIKFTNAGQITYGCRLSENKLHGFVEDTGCGIPFARQKSIFNSFVQADSGYSRAYEGSGLGLTITKAFVEMMGGSIDFKSEPGKGTRFEFVVDVALAETTTSVTNSYAYKKLPDEQRFLILVAEDDEVSFLFLTKLLAGKNLNFLHAKEGSEAVDMCRNHQDIALVLMDMKMPVMDGFEATRIIKTFRPSLPIIAVTAFAFSEDREKALSAGCDDYLSKPLNTKKVIEMINRYLKA